MQIRFKIEHANIEHQNELWQIEDKCETYLAFCGPTDCIL